MRRLLPMLLLALAGCGGPAPVQQTSGPTNCQILWVSPGSVTTRYDVYLFDMPVADWTSGTKSLQRVPGEQRVATFYADYDFDTDLYGSVAIATAGTVTVTVGGTEVGDAVSFADAGGHAYFPVDADGNAGPQVGSGGAASFDGTWGPPDTVVPGQPGGQVMLDYLGSSRTIGDYSRFASCYRATPQ